MILEQIKSHVTEAARLRRVAKHLADQAADCDRMVTALEPGLDDDEKKEYAKFKTDFAKKEAARG